MREVEGFNFGEKGKAPMVLINSDNSDKFR